MGVMRLEPFSIAFRFTKDTVVIQPSSKNKATCELQLPSMAALTSKTSSQSFFLRLLKVIISLRDSIRGAIKKYKQTGKNLLFKLLYTCKINLAITGGPGPLGGGPLMSSTVMSGDRSLIHAVTAGMSESASREFREAFERVVNSRHNEEQPMDVDQDPLETTEAAAPPRRVFESMVDIDESSDEDVVLPTTARNIGRPPPLVPAPASTNTTTAATTSAAATADLYPVDVNKLLPRLSTLLDLNKLWETLSECLLELGHTPDHHAVLVLQVNIYQLK
jgi:hypothetical protein